MHATHARTYEGMSRSMNGWIWDQGVDDGSIDGRTHQDAASSTDKQTTSGRGMSESESEVLYVLCIYCPWWYVCKGSFLPIRIPVERRKVMNGKEPTKKNAPPSDREACYITKRNRFPRSEDDDTVSTGMESVAPPRLSYEKQ